MPRDLLLSLLITSGRVLVDAALPAVPDDNDVLQYIDPLIGSANGGNVFSGACLPYGMAKAVADTDSENNQGSFAYDGAMLPDSRAYTTLLPGEVLRLAIVLSSHTRSVPTMM
ncbi:hypothetical protein N7523_005545 [Penicillium sp. IBT 18751x]|nr:hypothetical protein N7523_005869 [Penicillium sp. IBT 18751x]KAJ6117794.1 hypothetical protein N7523_005545 [Penicillium sp. IBT 18751x]